MNPFYQSQQKNRQDAGNRFDFRSALQNLSRQTGMAPDQLNANSEQMVRQLIASGQMTQEQFEQLGHMADSVMTMLGMKK